MLKKKDNGVLGRRLARDLTPDELEAITGGFFTACSLLFLNTSRITGALRKTRSPLM
jgi:hypothetical protein